MSMKDYLHSELIGKTNNNLVFQETYETIRQLSWKMSEKYCDILELSPKQKEEYMDVFISDIEAPIIHLVNLAIDKFEK